MANIDFDTYFNESKNKYYDSKIVISILEDILGKSFDEIKREVNENQIVVTKEQIESYLEQKFIEEEPEVKKKIESRSRPQVSSNAGKWTKRDFNFDEQNYQDVLNSCHELGDEMVAARYCFVPYTLEYFNKYTTIVRNKANLLLKIIEKIGNKNTTSIQKVLTDLDIRLDKNGNILKSDIIRLITPTIYNINVLEEKLSEANDLSTYLTFKMSKHSLLRDSFSEGEVYPVQSIQVKSLFYDYIQGNVDLSERQRKTLEEKQSISRKKCAEQLIG